jgi:hypothetical protein
MEAFTMKQKRFCEILAALAVAAALGGCNLFGKIDSPKSNAEILVDAQAKMDNGNCADAVTALNAISEKDDSVYHKLGWAQLCVGGATVERVAGTLLTYSSSSGDFTVVGKLANNLIGTTGAQISSISDAIGSFGSISNANLNDRSVNVALANIVKAAALLSTASGDKVKVRAGDVALAACASATCSGGGPGASCDASSAGTLSQSDANSIGTLLIAAQTAMGQASGDLGSAQNLAQQLGGFANSGVNAAAAQINRCYIVQKMISQ